MSRKLDKMDLGFALGQVALIAAFGDPSLFVFSGVGLFTTHAVGWALDKLLDYMDGEGDES